MLNKNILSMDIGTKNIKLVECREKNQNINIEKAIITETPEGSIKNGRIISLDSLREALKETLRKEKIKAQKTVITIQSKSIISRELEIPFTKNKEEMNSIVKYELKEYIPIDIEDYVLQYKILEKKERKAKVIVIALLKTIVEDYLDLIKKLRLKPIALDINTNSLIKLLNNSPEDITTEKTVAFVDLGYSNIHVTIISNGKYMFDRLIELGSKDMDKNICDYLGLPIKKAEKMKLNIKNINDDSDDFEEQNSINMIRSALDIWVSEIERVLKYYTSRKRENNIDAIYIYGGASNLNGIDIYFKESFNINTFILDDISRVEKKDKDLNIASYINSLGAVIRK
ncbi:MAG: type IV pilus assembly protein PilM [Firmicutes bacterium]|nr:type IV pilus assembly protein PilM [Bacillota bacterium]MTI70162.1 type IV pilus assembly protein PilM [Bacillota bacterium]